MMAARHQLGALSVRLDELWKASNLGGDLDSMRFDLVGQDGFRPSRHGFPALPGSLLKKGYLQLEAVRIEWEPESGVECAYRIKALGMVVGYDHYSDWSGVVVAHDSVQ